MMLAAKIYQTENDEVMVLSQRECEEVMPSAAAIRLLADRRSGVGADRVLLFTGTQREPSFLVFAADGTELRPEAQDYQILVRYLAEEHIAANPAELARVFGANTFLEAFAARSVTSIEVRLTDCFVRRLAGVAQGLGQAAA